MKPAALAMLLALLLATAQACAREAPNDAPKSAAVSIPGDDGGIGFDDMGYSLMLHKIVVPAGRTGAVALIDPETLHLETIAGFSRGDTFGGGHGEGVTSADVGAMFMLATDRTAQRLDIVDVVGKRIANSAALASGPDYVRYVRDTNEAWVTEPGHARIEVFALSSFGIPQPPPTPVHRAFIDVPGGPESLVIDSFSGRAYTNLWKDETVAINLRTRMITARWPNRCAGSRGLAIDPERELVFVGCEEGKLSVLNLKTGKQVDEVAMNAGASAGVDIIAWNPKLRHVYMPGADSATTAIIAVSAGGKAQLLGTIATPTGAHCAATDNRAAIFVCDPAHGRILKLSDPYPASK